MLHKKLLYLFSGIILSGLGLFATNFFVEEKILKNHIIDETMHRLFYSKEKILISYTLQNFNLIKGFRISNVKITSPISKSKCSIEEIWIQFDTIKLLTNTKPKKLLFIDPVCNISSDFSLPLIFNTLLEVIHKNNIDIELKNFKFNFEEYNLNNINLKMTLENDFILIKGESKDFKSNISFYGKWKLYEQINRIYFELKNLNINKEMNLLNLFKLEFPEFSNYLKFKTNYYITGKGSIDITEDGYSLNFKGNFNKLYSNNNFISLKDLNGNIHYLVIKGIKKNLHLEKTNIQFIIDKIEQKIHLENQLENNKRIISITGNIFFNNSKIKTNTNSKGNIEFDLDIIKTNDKFEFFSNLTLQKFLLIQNQELPNIFIKNLNLKNLDNSNIFLNMDGTINSLNFNYNSKINYNSNTKFWNISGKFNLLETDYQVLIQTFTNLYNFFIKEIKKENSTKYEDFGPGWKNKFINSDIYNFLFKNIQVDNKIQFINSLQKNFPEIQGYLKINPQNINLYLEGKHKESNSSIELKYSTDFLTMIPYNSFLINLNINDPQIELPFFCNNCKDYIKKITFSYNSNSNGIYFADFYLNNYSNFKLEIDSIKIQNNYRKDLLEKLLNIHMDEPIKLKIYYNTQCVFYNPIQLELENNNFIIKANGQYNIFNGGKLNFYFFNKNTSYNKNFIIKIRKDGVWIPSYFF